MSDAPKRIWAFYTPDDFDDSATITAYEAVQHGGQEYVRADLIRDAVLAGMRIATFTSIEMVPEAIQDAINEIMVGKND